eukprot:TRINITY_DN14398_c0_g1_i1.p1 TRINITY_DN14398_c0_g1~~TRINITY_DN14398_c0_g1_i1.p1  ORF type:complete len:482 (-),score=59.53 TRINITY_DN14398_c0_g1_i1:108-1553(-)
MAASSKTLGLIPLSVAAAGAVDISSKRGLSRVLQVLRSGRFLGLSFAEIARNPVILLLLMRLLDALWKWWRRQSRLRLGEQRILCTTNEIDGDIIQGCILSTEHLLSLGRVEKRTLFSKPLLEVMGGNEYLVQEMLKGAVECSKRSSNCMVMRWMPPDERYHALQSCLNAISSLFATNYVHFNALDGEMNNLFKSTWYVLTVTLPCRPQNASNWTKSDAQAGYNPDTTCTFTDMSRKPRATLRVAIINESELRRIADDKLRPPKWGFFNERHAERYRMLVDIARNFQLQLMRHPSDNKGSVCSRSPFTSAKAHAEQTPKETPDGGLMKRVQSQPNLAQASGSLQNLSKLGRGEEAIDGGGTSLRGRRKSWIVEQDDGPATGEDGHQADSNNCFLRLHVPHYTGPSTSSVMPSSHGNSSHLPPEWTGSPASGAQFDAGGSSGSLRSPSGLAARRNHSQAALLGSGGGRSQENYLHANSFTIR